VKYPMHFAKIAKFLFLFLLIVSTKQPILAQDCTHLPLNTLKETAVSTLVKSNAFKEFSKKYPKNTRFAFPLEMVSIKEAKTCLVEVTVYIDERDHYALVTTFLVNSKK